MINPFITLKNISLFIISTIIAYIMPVIPLIAIVLLFIIADTGFGLYKSYKLKIKINSKTLSDAGIKVFIYISTILLVFLADKLIAGGKLMYIIKEIPYLATKGVATFWLLVESISIYENIKAITGVSYYQKLKLILTRTKDIKSDISDIISFNRNDELPPQV